MMILTNSACLLVISPQSGGRSPVPLATSEEITCASEFGQEMLTRVRGGRWSGEGQADGEDPGPAGLCQGFWNSSSGESKSSVWSAGEKMVLPMWYMKAQVCHGPPWWLRW